MGKITIKKAAELLNCSEQFLRVALQQGKLPFGTAVKMSKRNYTYYINPNQFYEFIGLDVFSDINGRSSVMDIVRKSPDKYGLQKIGKNRHCIVKVLKEYENEKDAAKDLTRLLTGEISENELTNEN
jgi:hypothetical protein